MTSIEQKEKNAAFKKGRDNAKLDKEKGALGSAFSGTKNGRSLVPEKYRGYYDMGYEMGENDDH